MLCEFQADIRGSISYFFHNPENGIIKWLFQNRPQQVFLELLSMGDTPNTVNMPLSVILHWFGIYGCKPKLLPALIHDWEEICGMASEKGRVDVLEYILYNLKKMKKIHYLPLVTLATNPDTKEDVKVILKSIIKSSNCPASIIKLL